jgi:hypothetical protein
MCCNILALHNEKENMNLLVSTDHGGMEAVKDVGSKDGRKCMFRLTTSNMMAMTMTMEEEAAQVSFIAEF